MLLIGSVPPRVGAFVLHFVWRTGPGQSPVYCTKSTRMWANANVMAAIPNIGGALCSTPQRFAVAHGWSYQLQTWWKLSPRGAHHVTLSRSVGQLERK